MARKVPVEIPISIPASQKHRLYPMKILTPLACALAIPFALSSCDSKDPSPPEGDESKPKPDAVSNLTPAQRESALAIGNDVSAALMKDLGAQLKAALDSGGPTAAITVCKSAAIPITAATSKKFDGVTISRTSLKTRNPANAPDPTDRALLDAWHALAAEDKSLPEPELRPDPDGSSVRFYKPIPVAEICLNCHGPAGSLPGELHELLAKLYPEDAATGYKLGDLRGAFRVTINPAKALK